MKTKNVFLIGLLLSFLTMTIMATISEDGDRNAISMYFVVFLLPVLAVVFLNTIFIKYINTLKKRNLKLIISFIPALIFLIACLFGDITIPQIDGNLVFVSLTGLIALGTTNIIWLIKAYRAKTDK